MVEKDKKTDTKEGLSEKDLEELNKDIKETKDVLVSKERQEAIEKAKKEAKEEAKQELAIQKKIEETEKANKELQEKLANQEKVANERLDALQSKVDNMLGSKSALDIQDPFKAPPVEDQKATIDAMSDEKIDEIEEESARKFLGSGYDDRFK